ncbi:response regulator [Halopseudomonas sp.]|uniref:response regulator n=1 Tax=Halopseudomonas sp. TaxID=2901191 RepID=UPI003561DB48
MLIAEVAGMSGKPLILLAEDERAIRKVMEILLESEGHEVLAAKNGREALDLLEDVTPNVIITDYMMPEMDGAAFLRAVRGDARLRKLPVLLMSSAQPTELPDHHLADQVFLKGGELGSLLGIVASLIARGASSSAESS